MKFWSRNKNSEQQLVKESSPEQQSQIEVLRYCCNDLITMPFDNQYHLAYNKLNHAVRLLSPEATELLNRCRQLQTLDEHAYEYQRSLAASIGGSDRLWIESIKEQLTELVSVGLLISDQEILKLCQQQLSVTADSVPEITSIGVVTRSRPASLKQCLISYLENSQQFQRHNDFVVMDDTPEQAARSETRVMLRELANKYNLKLYYAGLEEKQEFAKTLAHNCEVPSEVINFALFDPEQIGISIGANRNALLLHTAGDLMIGVDDDTVCQLTSSPNHQDGLGLESSSEATEYWFFPDHEATLKGARFDKQDFLESHEKLLGQSIGNCLSRFGQPSLDRVSSQFIRGLNLGSCKVAVTINGLIGDSGFDSPIAHLLLKGDSHQRLVESEEKYRSACVSREMLKLVRQNTITENLWDFQTTAIGYDNRELLPPFLPTFRGADGLFGVILRRCFGGDYVAHLPWAVLHAPMEPRVYAVDSLWKNAVHIPMIGIIVACTNSFSFLPNTLDGKGKLQKLGKYLMEVGELGITDFEELIRINLWNSKSGFASFVENHLRYHRETPDYWADDLRKIQDYLHDAIIKNEYIIPEELMKNRSVEDARQLSQRIVFKFGQLLYWWPDLVKSAKNLRTQSQRLAIPV